LTSIKPLYIKSIRRIPSLNKLLTSVATVQKKKDRFE